MIQNDNNNAQTSNFCLPRQDELNKITLLLNDNASAVEKSKLLNQLQFFVDMVLVENQKHNIIGKNTQRNIWTRHILDSLQLINFIKNDINNRRYNIIDLGSGAGFPAIPLAMALDNHITFVEKSPIKAKFLQNVTDKLNLKNTKIFNATIDEYIINKIISDNTIVVSRAFKSIDKILQLLKQPCRANKIKKIVLPKGQNWKTEIDNTPQQLLTNWQIKEYPSITGEGVVLVFEIL